MTDTAQLYEALNWLTHLAHGIGKSGHAPETGEFEAAVKEAERVLETCKLAPSPVSASAAPSQEPRAVVSLLLDAYERHESWCGFKRDSPGDSIHRRARDAALEFLRTYDDLSDFLKDGETIRERLTRERNDTLTLMNDLARERLKTEAAEQQLSTLQQQIKALENARNVAIAEATIVTERAEAAEQRLREIEDIPLARRQLPDGSVPGNTVECAHGWLRAYDEAYKQLSTLRAELEDAKKALERESGYRRVAWDSRQLLTDRASVAERMRADLESQNQQLRQQLSLLEQERDEWKDKAQNLGMGFVKARLEEPRELFSREEVDQIKQQARREAFEAGVFAHQPEGNDGPWVFTPSTWIHRGPTFPRQLAEAFAAYLQQRSSPRPEETKS